MKVVLLFQIFKNNIGKIKYEKYVILTHEATHSFEHIWKKERKDHSYLTAMSFEERIKFFESQGMELVKNEEYKLFYNDLREFKERQQKSFLEKIRKTEINVQSEQESIKSQGKIS